jgi:cysteine-S-conjugate beta-lyase
MSLYNFDTPVDRCESLSVKWNKQVIKSICNNEKAEPFWVADMDFTIPPAIAQALRAQADHAILGYPMFSSMQDTFCEWTRMRHHWCPEKDSVVIAPGMLTSLAVLVELISRKGEGVIVPLPAYQPFIRMVHGLGRKLLPWNLPYNHEQGSFSLDLESLEVMMKEDSTKVLLFCSPHNPTGLVFTPEELEAIARLAAQNNVVVLSDEIHADLAYTYSNHIPFDTVARATGCTAVTCMAPSKTFNIAGEHFSVSVFSDQELAGRFSRRLQSLFLGTDLLSSVTGLCGYRDGYNWLMELLPYLEGQAAFIDNFLKERIPSLKFVKPAASFIAFIDCTDILESVRKDAAANPTLYDSSRSPSGGLLSRFFGQRASVAMNDGTWFGKDYYSFVRINFGTQRSKLEEALIRMEKAVSRLP